MADVDRITVVLADDHGVVRSGLRLLLDQAGMLVLAEAADADSALRSVLGHKPSILVLDLNMPGEPMSLDIIPRVGDVSPGTRVVVLTMQEDPVFARAALRAGALGYVLKEAADDELRRGGPSGRGGRDVSQSGVGRGPRDRAAQRDGPPDDLTEREVQILRLVALGHTNSEIADQLYLSVRTVESHRSRIGQKLRLSTRAELVRYALDHRLLGEPE